MENKRKQERKELNQTIPVQDVINGLIIGELVNITTNGMMVISNEHIETNSIFQFSLQLPRPLDGQDSIALGVDCLWCRKVENFSRYWAGFQVIDASPDSRQLIDKLIADYARN